MTTLPAVPPYTPIDYYRDYDKDRSSIRIRDMPYGKHRESVMLSPSELIFRKFVVGTISTPQFVSLENTGYHDVDIASIFTVGDFDTNAYINVLKAGQTYEIPVTFKPNQLGLSSGGLYVDAPSAVGVKFIKLSGSGVGVGEDTLPPEYTLIQDANTYGSWVDIPNGVFAFIVTGTFAGASVHLEWRPDSTSEYLDIPGTLAAEEDSQFGIPLNLGQARAMMTNPAPDTSLTVKLVW